MTAWAQRPLRHLIDETKRPRLAETKGQIWNLNLDQIEAGSGRILSRQLVEPEALGPSTYPFEVGTVLYSKLRPYLNKVVVADAPGFATTELVPIRCDAKSLLPEYLAYVLRSPAFVSYASAVVAGAKMPRMVMSQFWAYEIPVPPLTEQRRIAAILDQADALRAKRREALAQLDSLTQSIFIEMFGDPVAGAQTAALCPLESILEEPFQNGAYFQKQAYCEKGGVEMVHMSDAFGGTIVRGNLRRVSCGASDVEKYALKTDDILIARRSITYEGAAQPCMVPRSSAPLIFESSFIRVKPDKARITPLYLFHYLNNERVRQKYVRPYVTQSTISGINQSNLAQVPVVQPTLIQQQLFAAQIAVVDQMKRTFRASLLELNTLFASLQHRAFTGQL